jgi:hypothetical protein
MSGMTEDHASVNNNFINFPRDFVTDEDTARIVHLLLRAIGIDDDFKLALSTFSQNVQSFFIHDILKQLTVQEEDQIAFDMKINNLMERYPGQMQIILIACAKAIYFDAMSALCISKETRITAGVEQCLKNWFAPYSTDFKYVYLNLVHFLLYKKPLFYEAIEVPFFDVVAKEYLWIKQQKPKEEIIEFDGDSVRFTRTDKPIVNIGNNLRCFDFSILLFASVADTIIVVKDGTVLRQLSPYCRSLAIRRNMALLYGCALSSYVVLIPVIGYFTARWAGIF